MAKSTHTDTEFREAATRLHPNARVEPWGAVMRPADGGAFVEAHVWVSDEDVAAAKPAPKLTVVPNGR